MALPSYLRAPLAVSLGAIPGALCRYYLGGAIDGATATPLPLGTLTMNLLGCFGLGLFTALTMGHRPISPEVRLLVATGFWGSVTTFSTFELEVSTLLDTAELGTAAWIQGGCYWLGSPLLGLACLYAGETLGHRVAQALGHAD